jgi:DNA-binding response OmpR family regulator
MCVLIVEDESLLVMLLEDLLQEFGFATQAYRTIGDALAALEVSDFQLAILDVNLGTSLSYAVADALIVRKIPFAFATGYGRVGVDAKYADVPVLNKPIDSVHLRAVVELLEDAV